MIANWFEDLTKTLANEKVSRRTTMRRVVGTVAGTVFISAFPDLALAKKNRHCPVGSDCSCGDCYGNCIGIQNTNCFCFTELGGKPGCGCNTYCSQVQTCSTSKNVPRAISVQ